MSRYACIIDGCSNTYAQVAGLKKHQSKNHTIAYTKNGLQMKRVCAAPQEHPNLKKLRNDEVTDQTQVIPLTLSNDLQLLRTENINLRNEITGLRDEFQIFKDKQTHLDEATNSLFAHITELREHASLIAKKTTKWCVVCFERENDYAFTPCRHKCVCKQCAQLVINKHKKCPICRRETTNAVCIYDISAWDTEITN